MEAARGLGGQLRSEPRRIARPSSYWPRSQSTGLGQGQTHEDLGERANERGQAQTPSDSQNQAQSNLLFAVDLDEFLGAEKFGEYLDFLSNQGDDSISHLRTTMQNSCRAVADLQTPTRSARASLPSYLLLSAVDPSHTISFTDGYPSTRSVPARNR